MKSGKIMIGLILAGMIVLSADFGHAASYNGNVTIRPMSPTASWTCALQPKDSATFSVTVIHQESGYRLKSGPTAEITGQDILWTGGPTTFNVVNEAPEVSSTQAKVTCVWEPYGGGPGPGPRPPDINGLATGTAQLKVAHIEWGAMTPQVQVADGNSMIAWEVKLVDDNGALVSGISVNFTLSAGNGAWQLSPQSGPGPRLTGTVLSTEGSRGSLQVNYTYFGHAKSSTSGQITFVGVEKVQHRIGSGAWADTPEPVVVAPGTTVEFKAIPKPSDASWPSGKPVWSGASGSGGQASQTFNTFGNNTVSAECGNTKIRHVLVPKVESITGLENLYCTHQDCSANLTAVLTDGASLPEGCSIVWEGDADFSNQSGLTVTAKFANHAGKNKKVTAKIGSQSPTAESSAFTVVEHTEITGVTVVTYNFAWVNSGVDYGITTPQTIAVDITAYFNHPGHTWKCKVTSATDVIQQGWHLVAGVSQASTAAATTEAIYRKMVADLQVYGQGEGILWYIIEAVQAHETSHSNDWKAILNPYFSTFSTTVDALSVPYVNDTRETPAQARAAILALSAYITASSTLINGSMGAWEAQIPDSEIRAYAAEVPLILIMIAALDNKAAFQVPPWTR